MARVLAESDTNVRQLFLVDPNGARVELDFDE
jgi:hypothetical protein